MLTNEEQTLWSTRTAAERPPEEGMTDPLWRLRWLYKITDRSGRLVAFEPTPEQREVIVALHVRGWRRIIIPKARQLGMSTVLCLISLDGALFTAGYSVALVDKRADDAEKKMREKVRVAWEALPAELRAAYEMPPGYDTTTRIGFRLKGRDEVPGSYEVGVNFRGGTCQLLHISEWGWIQANDERRSKEILAGSLPAAEQGAIVIETTWEGGKSGDLWPLVEEALAAEKIQEAGSEDGDRRLEDERQKTGGGDGKGALRDDDGDRRRNIFGGKEDKRFEDRRPEGSPSSDPVSESPSSQVFSLLSSSLSSEASAPLSSVSAPQGPDTRWRILFFGWWTCPGYATEHGHEDEVSRRLLDGHERSLGFAFTREQRLWYAAVRRKLKRLVYGEYPTTLEECWHAPVAGSIYGDEMDRLRAAGRVGGHFSMLRELPLYTFWDLGMSDSTVLLLVQFVGTEIHFLDHHEAEGQPASYYAGVVQRWEADYKPVYRHLLPHDAARRSVNDATSYVDTLARLGLRNTIVIPASHDVWWGINLVRDLLPRCQFHARLLQPWQDAEHRERLSAVQCLEAYRRRVDTNSGGALTESPVHDAASHTADAVRMVAEARSRGLVGSGGGAGAERKAREGHFQGGARGSRVRMVGGG